MDTADVAIVGAGIVGLAVAREVLRRTPEARVVVVEKESYVAAHQTGHNSGVVHGGIYYQPGSLKARLCVEGARLMYAYAEDHGIPHERCGKLIVAIDDDELSRLDELERRGIANGVPGLQRVDAAGIREIEPRATGIAALHAPDTGIIDYAVVARTLQRELTARGVAFRFDTEVHRVVEGAPCRVYVGNDSRRKNEMGVVEAGRVIVCAGLWADRLAVASGAAPDPRIVPFRGAYLRLPPTDEPAVRGMIYPVPDPSLPFLGVHLTRQIGGGVLLGPTATLVASRDGYRLGTVRGRDVVDTMTWPGSWRLMRRFWRTGLAELRMVASRRAHLAAAAAYVPSLTRADLDGSVWAGVRAQAVGADGTLVDDFVLSAEGQVVHVRNAPSPAATSAFALARELLDRVDAAEAR